MRRYLPALITLVLLAMVSGEMAAVIIWPPSTYFILGGLAIVSLVMAIRRKIRN